MKEAFSVDGGKKISGEAAKKVHGPPDAGVPVKSTSEHIIDLTNNTVSDVDLERVEDFERKIRWYAEDLNQRYGFAGVKVAVIVRIHPTDANLVKVEYDKN